VGGPGGWHVWMDEVEIVTRTSGAFNTAVTNIAFGFYSNHERTIPAPFDVFLDDLAIGNQRIGCGK
jgi:hypothetical protein